MSHVLTQGLQLQGYPEGFRPRKSICNTCKTNCRNLMLKPLDHKSASNPSLLVFGLGAEVAEYVAGPGE